ncbi:SRPBCC family protein [Bacteroides sp. 224]|uniref:SRPBCC family protein n=1 Tax=Bacteroides sp. 224 TaxID=2302936 RepID=UPI0013D7DDF4|nr:SRPBCC family protein [Bacteroides sp. 224]NDV66394.1 SRPBCC family protein [Bacteroides sp. 224]
MTKIESAVKTIPFSNEQVYNKLSDLNNLESLKDKIPADKVQDISFDTDTLSFSVSPVGQITFNVVEREPHKCVKFATVQSPMPLNLWIQIVPMTESECKMKLTVGVDVNPFMKGMIQKPLKEGLEKMADALAMIQYA